MAIAQENALIKDYFDLLKPRVMSLVVFTGLCGLLIAPGDIHPFLAVISIICLAFGAGAAGAVNMWYDRDIDAIMTRTKNRPIPAGRIPPDEAMGFAVIISMLSVMLMGLAVNWLAAGILAFANVFYTVIYTIFLKRSTPQNIVIGGAAGAFPPMIGWAAVTGDITWMPILLFLIIFLWTPPHFWALALYSNEDYKRANIPMLTVTHGKDYTRWHMLLYTLILACAALSPFALGYTGYIYGIASLVLNAFFILANIQVLRKKNNVTAKIMFAYSIFYLFALFFALIIDHYLLT